MNILTIVTISFLILEGTNVLALYFFPDTKYANAIGLFKAWEKSKIDSEVHDLVKYLANWVAGTKLIVICLLIAILVAADDRTLSFSGIALVFSIASFFWRMFPLAHKMDRERQIEPERYSIILGWMIGVFILMFAAAVVVSLAGE